MLKKKTYTDSGRFKPYPFIIKKDRRHDITIESPPIDWNSLSAEQLDSQWGHCLNMFWFYEKEGIINKNYLKPHLINFMKKNGYTDEQIKRYESAPDWMNSVTVLSIAYLLMSDVKKPDSEAWLLNKINEIIASAKPVENKPEGVKEKPKHNIQYAMRKKLSEVLGELHGMEDDTEFKTKPDLLKWFTHRNVAKVHMDDIEAKFKPVLTELEEVMEGKDEQLNEGYSEFSKSDIKKRIEWYKHLLTDVDAYRRLKISTRKIRTSKPKSPTKLVSKLKYLAYSDEHKIQSISAEKIIGCDTLWVYNQKQKRLIQYIASEMDKELTVKGSTIVGWDPKGSYGKTLRKPSEQLTTLMSGGKVAMRNFLKDIKGKDKTVNGRINRDCLLLRTF
jgi:hypothetical protein